MLTILITGISGSGKTTIANRLSEFFSRRGIKNEVLDGDVLREKLSQNLGYSEEERNMHRRKIFYIAGMLTRHGIVSILPLVASTRAVRDEARKQAGKFMEVYLKCPLAVCEQRDPKGYYKNIRAGKIKNFVGVDIPYEEPVNPELVLETDGLKPEDSVKKIVMRMEELGLINF